MFRAEDGTNKALNALMSAAHDPARPLVLWVGAGVSSWAGYPRWLDVADKMHTIFSREEPDYDKAISSQYLKGEQYPELFEQMRHANQARYYSILSAQFRPAPSSGVYRRFIQILRQFSTISMVTTNVDEALEHNLPEHVTVQRSDIESLPLLLHERRAFICKLHGTVSSVESMVFSTRDYQNIQQDDMYIDALRSMFSAATVLFIGYGLRDGYVLKALQNSLESHPLFGSGPHFIVTPEDRVDLPAEVRRIRYVAEKADHRDALLALEAIAYTVPRQAAQFEQEPEKTVVPRESIYYIADILPVGTWSTSQTMNIQSSSGVSSQMIVGEGYVNEEIADHGYSALHDIVVGLICFDVVAVSIDHLARVHNLLGAEAFWIFAKSDSLRLVIPPAVPAVVFPGEQSLTGFLKEVSLGSSRSSFDEFSPITITERIRRQLSPAKGKENEAEELFKLLESTVIDASIVEQFDSVSEKTRGALVNPRIRQLLGISPGMPYNSVPRWMTFPILRLAGVMNSGVICQQIKASSTRMIFGSEKLASVAFASTEGNEWADNAASFVLTGRFDLDVGALIEKEPSLLLGILKFRESSSGERFRTEVAQRLAMDDGGQIVTAINAGLYQAVPSAILQQARDQLSALYTATNAVSGGTVAVWGNLRNSDTRIAGWKKRSKAMLSEVLASQRLNNYDYCPCGSGEKVKFCCMSALS